MNALAYEVCFELQMGKFRANHITLDLIMEAKESLIKRRDTHLDQLADKLKEERVRRVIGPMLTGKVFEQDYRSDDVGYLIDLGLITHEINLGMGRTDLFILWHLPDGTNQRFVIECKIQRGTREKTIETGINQVIRYADT